MSAAASAVDNFVAELNECDQSGELELLVIDWKNNRNSFAYISILDHSRKLTEIILQIPVNLRPKHNVPFVLFRFISVPALIFISYPLKHITFSKDPGKPGSESDF